MYYKFDNTNHAGFMCGCEANYTIYRFIDNREFMITERNDGGDVTAIAFRGTEKSVYLSDISTKIHGDVIFSSDEVDRYLVTSSNDSNDKVYAVLVHQFGTTGFLIRTLPGTLEDAESFADKWVKENPKDTAIVFKGITRYSAETKVVVTTEPYGA
jgi:hypothetical protein